MFENFQECPAHPEGHRFERQEIPSEFITGVEGGLPLHVIQCKYCGCESARTHNVSITTDVVFVPAYKFSIGGSIIENVPAGWDVYFSRQTISEHNYGIPYERCYHFVTKPTRRQIRKARRNFKVCYDMYENYN